MKTLDEMIDTRNAILLASHNSDMCWQALGIANRHIKRVFDGELPMTPGLINEIEACFARARKIAPVS